LPNSSRLSGYLSAEQRFPIAAGLEGYVGGAANFVGDRQSIFTSKGSSRMDLPGYTNVDLQAGVIRGPWKVNLYVNNVADERGLVTFGELGFASSSYVYIQPRTVGASVVKTF